MLSTPVERERLAFVREVWSALMTMDVTLMTLDSVVRPLRTCTLILVIIVYTSLKIIQFLLLVQLIGIH